MDVERFDIAGPVLLTPQRFADARGFLSEIFNEARLAPHLDAPHFVQENHIRSERTGTIRGLHLQTPPSAQGKLVRVVHGGAFEVAVDLRPDSVTFGRHVAVELTAESGKQFWIPPGFAHGLCTLVPQTEITYKLTAYYDPQSELGVAWNDPDLAIRWPHTADPATLSERDRRNPGLKDAFPGAAVARSAAQA